MGNDIKNEINTVSETTDKHNALKKKNKKKAAKKKIPFKFDKKYLFLSILIPLLMLGVARLDWFSGYESMTYDALSNISRNKKASSEIIIIGITDECLESLGSWPWRRDIHARLLDTLTEGEAAVVGMDIFFVETSAYPDADQEMVDATKRAVPVVSSAAATITKSSITGYHGAESLRVPFDDLKKAAPYGFINVIPDPDGILRKVVLALEYEGKMIPSFDVLIWGLYLGLTPEEIEAEVNRQFLEQKPETLSLGNSKVHLNPHDAQMSVNFRGIPGSYMVLPYHKVIQGDYHPSTYKDKIIMVGYFTLGLGDYYFTPPEKKMHMFGIEHHSNAIDTMLNGDSIRTIPLEFYLPLVFIVTLLSMILFRKMRPIWSVSTFIMCSIIIIIISYFLMQRIDFYMETGVTLIALFVGFLTASGYSFAGEMKERQRVTGIFGRYVAQQVVDEILQVGEENLKLGGVRRNITILFIDIRGFTPLSEKLTPEEVVSVLNEYFKIVTRCIFENKGTVDKFMGDAVMALFNAPVLLDDHAYWAVKTGQDILKHGTELQRKVMEMCGVTLNFGIGINSGDAVVGNIGSDTRMEYTAIGDSVNLAARLESNSKAGQVLVSESVYESVKDKLPLEAMGEITVKGKSKPIKIYQLKVD